MTDTPQIDPALHQHLAQHYDALEAKRQAKAALRNASSLIQAAQLQVQGRLAQLQQQTPARPAEPHTPP